MLDHMQKATRYLWAFVEFGFLTVLAVILIYLILRREFRRLCFRSC